MTIGALHILRPEILWLLLPAVLLALLLWQIRQRAGDWSRVIDPQLLPLLLGEGERQRSFNPLPLLLILWLLTVLAASGPSFRQIPQPVHQKQDALVLILDLSYSMLAEDVSPSRLDRARQKLLDLLNLRREGQTALVAYAGDAHIVSPLTDDNPTIANLLPALSPLMMPVAGSDSQAAVRQALTLLSSAGVRAGRLLLVTDGVHAQDLAPLASQLRNSGAQLNVLGVGTPEGAPIPLPQGGFLKDRNGEIVIPALLEAPLVELARDSGGHYQRLQLDDRDIAPLLEPLDELNESSIALDRRADTWEDQGYWLLLLVLPGALLAFRRGWVACALPLLLLAEPQTANAFEWQDLWLTPDQQGQRALAEGDAEAAASLFDNPQWHGSAAYQAQQYESAEQAFAQGDSANDWYNRGNALARGGKLEEALAAYQESLARDPDRSDAKENLNLVEELLEQQKQQEQEQEQEQQQQSQDGEQENSDQQADNQQQQDQQNADQEQGQNQQQQSDPSSSPTEDSANQPSEQEQKQDQAQSDDKTEQDEQEEQQQSAESGKEEGDPADNEQSSAQANAAPVDPEALEDQQAMEQWLRRVPDDPAGLLREKFRYESRQREQAGQRKDNDVFW